MSDSTAPHEEEMDLIAVLLHASDREGVGPKRGLDLMDVIRDVTGPIVRMIRENPEEGGDLVSAAVGYAHERAASRFAREEEAERRREEKRRAKSSTEDVQDDSPDELPAEETPEELPAAV